MEKNTINFAKLTGEYKSELVKRIKEWCSINSQFDEKSSSNKDPFGTGVTRALEYFAHLASEAGFNVTNYDNYVVEATLGTGKKDITIMAHADVVPEGTGWSHNPFEVKDEKGVLYGRGVADDKGPALACFYAIKALKDNKLLSPNYTIRFLVGGNEESGSLCMEHYFKTLKKPQPTCGFSPDSSFPLIFAEKGIFNFELMKNIRVPGLISIHGGVAANSVIEKCTLQLELNDSIIPFIVNKYPDVHVVTKDDVVNLTFTGLAAHGSVPQEGVNAGMKALSFLAKYTSNLDIIQLVDLLSDVYGKGVNGYAESAEMGKNSLNVGLINYSVGKPLTVVVNFRFVNGVDEKALKQRIKDKCKPFSIKFSPTSPLLYFNRRSLLIKALMKAYIQETGDTSARPLSTGGGTYAKEAKNIVAFGMEFPHSDPKMHAVGENVSVDDLLKGMAIYARGVYELGKLIDENKI